MSDRWTTPIAYLLTFTAYGAWLYGDPRGSVNRKAPLNEKYVPPDAALQRRMRHRMRHSPVKLESPARTTVQSAIEDYCKFKGWKLFAVNVRTNHVHVVVEAVEPSSKMLNAIKARATRLLRESGLFGPDQPVWAERGNVARLRSPQSVSDAAEYVRHGQGADI
jgi:REP element-mobilizing transposase RayT